MQVREAARPAPRWRLRVTPRPMQTVNQTVHNHAGEFPAFSPHAQHTTRAYGRLRTHPPLHAVIRAPHPRAHPWCRSLEGLL